MKRISEALPWLEPHWRRLAQARARDRLPHALLFEGPPGMGKRALAHHLARALLCRRPSANGEGCGTCPDCRRLYGETHPDFLELAPEADRPAIRVDQVRDFCTRLGLSPSAAGGYRVALIHPAEAMNRSAANSLLKTLEEPMPGRVIVLVTEQPGALLPTIRSRCQRLRFLPPERAPVAAWLVREQGIPREAAETLLALTDGAPLAALALAEEARLAEREAVFTQWLGVAQGTANPFTVAAAWAEQGTGPLRWVLSWLEDLVRLAMAPQARIKNVDRRPILGEMARTLAPGALLELHGRWLEVLRLAGTGVNLQLLLEALLMDWAALRGKA